MGTRDTKKSIAVVIPCYRVRDHVLDVISSIGPEVSQIICVDDACPDRSGDFIESEVADPRVKVLRHEQNKGVGGAVLTGYQAAIDSGATVIVKLDGDGQMDPGLVPKFVEPVLSGEADYTKGNRFFNPSDVKSMPFVRLFGNAAVSFLSKISSGYWTIFDPTNGFTAIHADVARHLPLDAVAKRYFFESDMLFHLGGLRASVKDIPMTAKYGDEESGLSIPKIIGPFLGKYAGNFVKRIFLNYLIRDFNVGSVELLAGLAMFLFGSFFGVAKWVENMEAGTLASAGTVMLAGLPVMVGLQLLIGFLNYDIANTPSSPIHRLLK